MNGHATSSKKVAIWSPVIIRVQNVHGLLTLSKLPVSSNLTQYVCPCTYQTKLKHTFYKQLYATLKT